MIQVRFSQGQFSCQYVVCRNFLIFLRLKSINEQSVNFQRRVPDETGVCALIDYVATAQVSERRVDVSMEEI